MKSSTSPLTGFLPSSSVAKLFGISTNAVKEWRDAHAVCRSSRTGRTIWSGSMLGGAITQKAAVSPKKQNTKADLRE